MISELKNNGRDAIPGVPIFCLLFVKFMDATNGVPTISMPRGAPASGHGDLSRNVGLHYCVVAAVSGPDLYPQVFLPLHSLTGLFKASYAILWT